MTYSELRQLAHSLTFYGGQREFSDIPGYADLAARLNDQINGYLAPDAPAFDNQALGEVLDTLGSLRRTLSGVQGSKARLVEDAEAQLGDIENLFSQVDVTKGGTLAQCVDDIAPRTVRVAGKMDQMGGQASSRNLLKRPAPGGQQIDGFFTEEEKLFEVAPALAETFYRAKNAHKSDREFQTFCENVEKSTYGLRTLALCFDVGYNENKMNQELDDYDIPGKAYDPDMMVRFGLMELPGEKIYDAFNDFLKNPNIHGLLKDVREIASDKYISNADIEQRRYGTHPSALTAEAGSSMTGRNVAMSRVANLLGISSIVARSSPIAVERDGVTIQGVFMEKAQGLDYPKNTSDLPSTPFIDAAPDAFSGEGLKSLADLQILDYLCQNVDRHQNNMLYTFGEDHKLKTVMGIDHDLSFGTKECPDDQSLQNGAALDELGVISESSANAVRRMTPEMLTNALRDTGLTSKEIKAACDRLEKLQARLSAPETFRAGEKAELGKLKLVPDAEWKNVKRADLSLAKYGQNIFRIVGTVEDAIKEKQAEVAKSKVKPVRQEAAPKHFAESASVDELDPNRLREYQQSIAELNDTLKTTEGMFHGSNQQYKDMREALDRLTAMSVDATRPLTEPEQIAYYDALTEVSNTVNAYITYKTKRADSGRTAETRLNTANELKKLVAPHLDNYREAMHAAQEAELAKVDNELREEQRKFDAIVESLTDSVCMSQKNADRADVQNTIKNGGTLKDMVRSNEELERMYTLSQEKPGELYKTYVRALSYAAAVATARNRESAPARQTASRQVGGNNPVIPGGKVK